MAAGNAGEILALIEKKPDFKILATEDDAPDASSRRKGFTPCIASGRSFGSLVTFMTEGPVVVMALERENAVAKWREVMGATNPANAADGTIRKLFATSIERNAAHGSDAAETAAVEIPFFFSTAELL